MKCLAAAALAWAAAAVPSLGDSAKPGLTVFSDARGPARRAPAPRLGDSLGAGLTVVSHGVASPRARKRAAVETDCGSSGKQQFVDQSLADCVARARAGAKAAQDPGSQLMTTFFKNDSPDVRARVAAGFDKIAAECQARVAASNTSVTCAPDQNQCQPGTSAVTTSYGSPDAADANLPKPEIRLCDQFFELNPQSAADPADPAGPARRAAGSRLRARRPASEPACGSLDSPGVMLHEMTHAILGTSDMIKANGEGSYGLKDVASLSPEQNLEHADTYALFAHAAALGCSDDDLRSGRTPEAGVPAGLYGNNATSDTQPDPAATRPGPGASDGRGPRRNATSTAPPPRTRTRGPTRGTRGPGPRVPDEQPPQDAGPEETQPPTSQDAPYPAQETRVLVEADTDSQPEAESTPAPSVEQNDASNPYTSVVVEQDDEDEQSSY